MSLVAAVAVAGLTTTASAQSMESAIKGTSVAGMVRYRAEHKDDATPDGEQAKFVLGTKSKVNDKVTFSSKFVGVLGNAKTDDVVTGSPALNVAKFTYAADGATITAGLMELATPWTDAADGARANGVLATKAVGGLTVAAAYFRDSTMGADKTVDLEANNIGAVAVIGKAGGVSYQAWYAQIGSDTLAGSNTALTQGGDAVAILADAKIGPAKVNASYASLEGDKGTLKKQTLTKAIVTVPVGGVTVVAGMAVGGSDGDLVTFDPDAKVGFESWQIRAGDNNQPDLKANTVAVVMPVSGVSLKLQRTHVEITGGEETEILLQASYKMSKNFGGYLRYATLDKADNARTRLEIKYTF